METSDQLIELQQPQLGSEVNKVLLEYGDEAKMKLQRSEQH
jgi:hypothetical protein